MNRRRFDTSRHCRTPLLERVEQALGCGWPLAAEVLARMRRRPQWRFRWDPAAFDRLAWEVVEQIPGEPDDPDWEIRVTATPEEALRC